MPFSDEAKIVAALESEDLNQVRRAADAIDAAGGDPPSILRRLALNGDYPELQRRTAALALCVMATEEALRVGRKLSVSPSETDTAIGEDVKTALVSRGIEWELPRPGIAASNDYKSSARTRFSDSILGAISALVGRR